IHLLRGGSAKFISEMSKRLDACLAKDVVARERGIKFGDGPKQKWRDVEADEVDLGKEFVTDNAKLGLNRKNALDGVIHDYVTHKPKKDGNFLRPKYVQLFAHNIDGVTIGPTGTKAMICF
ncbi:unnamed protein product, partial [Prorocentrum cordatum]